MALFMPKTSPLAPRLIAISACGLFFATAAHGQMVESAKGKFIFKDANGKTDSAEIVTTYQPKKIVHPFAKLEHSIDPKLMRAATIAQERAHCALRVMQPAYREHRRECSRCRLYSLRAASAFAINFGTP